MTTVEERMHDSIWAAMHDPMYDGPIEIHSKDHFDAENNPYQVITGTLKIGNRRAWIEAPTATGIIEDAWEHQFHHTASEKQMRGWLLTVEGFDPDAL